LQGNACFTRNRPSPAIALRAISQAPRLSFCVEQSVSAESLKAVYHFAVAFAVPFSNQLKSHLQSFLSSTTLKIPKPRRHPMLFVNGFRNHKGQSLTEAALIMPLVVLFLFTIIWFAKIMLTWQQITGAARYGTDLISYTPFSKSYIKQDIINYLCDVKNIGRTLDRNKLEINIEIHDAATIDYTLSLENFSSFNPLEILDDIKSLTPVGQEKSSVEIIYTYNTPFLLKAIGKETIQIKAHSEVLSGTGSAGQKTRQ
jgi:hypothetical protein